MKVTVLGCGPAGLMALHGALAAADERQVPIEVQVISNRRKSELFGCQYLHQPIPGVPDIRRTWVSYQLRGEADGYRRKVYGDDFYGTVSPEDLAGAHSAWDIRATYDWLWKKYQHTIIDGHVGPRTIWSLDGMIINSIPRPALCHQGHGFGSTHITAAGDAPERGIFVSRQFQCDDDSVVCNGEESPSWYRISRVFDHTTVEWPSSIKMVPVSSASRVEKPTSTDCNCHPEVLHVGRYGQWEKGVLSHTAYIRARLAVGRAITEGDRVASTEAGS